MTGDRSGAMLTALFEHNPLAVFYTTPEGVILAANPAACTMLGRSEDEICRLGRDGVIHMKSPAVTRMLVERERTGRARGDIVYVRADGSLVPVEVTSTVFEVEPGIRRTIVVAQDVLESHQALDAVVSSTRDLICSIDPATSTVQWFNQSMADYLRHEHGFDLRPGQALEAMITDVERREFWRTLFRQAQAEGTARKEYRHASSTRILDVRLTAMDLDGRPTGVVVCARDITDERDAFERLAASQAEYRAIVDSMAEGVVLQAADGRILSVNAAAQRIEDRAPEDMLDRTSEDPQWGAVREDGSPFPGSEHPSMCTLRTGMPQEGVVMGIRTPAGIRRWISINSSPIFGDDSRQPTAVVTTFHDITAQTHLTDQLRIAELAFTDAQEAMFVAGEDGAVLRVNGSFTRITGFSQEQAAGALYPQLLQLNLRAAEPAQTLRTVLTRQSRWEGEVWSRRADGEVYPLWLLLTQAGDGARGSHVVGSFVDLSQTKRAEQDIQTLSYIDMITSLPNRRLLVDRLEQSLLGSAREKAAGALLILDVDDFKVFNDTRGHRDGDALLAGIADRLRAAVRADTTVARMSSDDFAVLLEGVPGDSDTVSLEAQVTAQRLLGTVREPLTINGRSVTVTLSVGIATYRAGAPDAHELIRRAEAALLQGRKGTGSAVTFYSTDLHKSLESRLAIQADLHAGVPDQLLLHLQPQLDTSGVIVAAEALVRWQHPRRGLVPPAEFIPIAESDATIDSIGQWVLATACQHLADWTDDAITRNLTISVNVSPREFLRPSFVPDTLKIVQASGADASRVTLELTESMLIDNLDDVSRKMNELRGHGFGFALDDFGTGYSSLRCLKALPIDQLKIDQSFVRDLADPAIGPAFAAAIISLGHTLGMTVVAEGVETTAQRDILRGLGCDWYQGYLLSEPIPAPQLRAFAERNQ